MHFSKFLMPRPARILERERLFTKLSAWEDKKLIIIHGQAGQGKSTLAAHYANALSTPCLWYAMDREDDNPSVFLASFGQALQRTWPGKIDAPPLPESRYGFSGANEALGIGRWIATAFRGITKPGLIIFDDFTNTSAPPELCRILKSLFELTPPHVRFLLVSRTRPALEIARLRAQQAVAELTGDDLRFNDREVSDLFSTVFHHALDDAAAAAINRTAEGWPAGLVLMREYIASNPAELPAAVIADQHGEGYAARVFDYLAQEVFSHLPGDLQEFLLRTAIVDELSPGLMERLMEGGERRSAGRPARELLRELQSRNLFVTAATTDGSAIRYHALFRDFLRRRLHALRRPAEIKALYDRAATFYRQGKNPVRVVDLHLASGQFQKAVQEIEDSALELIGRGRTQTLLRWINSLPPGYEERPWFSFVRAVAVRFTDPRAALTHFENAFAEFRDDRTGRDRIPGQMLSLAGLIEACFYAGGYFKRMARAAATARALLRRGAREQAGTRARLLLAIGTASFFTGRLAEGAEALRRALDLFRKQGDHFYQIQSAIYLAPCAIYLADFRLARDAVRMGMQAHAAIPDEPGGEAALMMARAMTALFEGSFDEAGACVDACRELARKHDLEAFDFLTLDIGGWVATGRGDYRNAEALLSQCRGKADFERNMFFSTSSAHLRAVNYLHQGRLDEALEEAEYALTVRSQSGSALFHAVSLSAIGAVHRKMGHTKQADRELQEALKISRKIGAAQLQANILLLLAELRRESGRDQESLAFIAAGFRIGEERRFTFYHLLRRDEVAGHAAAAIKAGIRPAYCSRLLAASPAEPGPAKAVRIHCLGGFRVVRNGSDIRDGEWRSRVAKTFIKLLAAHDNGGVARETIMEQLWPDRHPAKRRTMLNSLIYRIRKILDDDGESCITLDDPLIALNSRRVWIDSSAFVRTVNDAAALKTGARPEDALTLIEQAIAGYAGDFLPGDLYEDWARDARERLRALYRKTLQQAGDAAETAGRLPAAEGFYEKLLAFDPCDEHACRWLMKHRAAQGRRTEAIRTFERCQLALQRELDLRPDNATAGLYRQIVEGLR